jgi:hypothetical protein
LWRTSRIESTRLRNRSPAERAAATATARARALLKSTGRSPD